MTALITVAAFLGFIVLFALAARFGTKVAGERLGTKVDRLHREGEHILDTGRAPEEWLGDGATSAETAFSRWFTERRALFRLKRLIRYFELTPAFTDVESREYVVGELRTSLDHWKGGGIEAMRAGHSEETSDDE